MIAKDNLYGNGAERISQQNVVVSNQTAWTQLMNSMNANNNQTNNFTTTTIDFNKFQIIAVFDNIKTAGGYSVDITTVVENQNDIVVTIKHLSNGGITTVMTQPFHIVKIPRTTKPVIFQ